MSNATHRGECLAYWIGSGTEEDAYRSTLSDFAHTTGEGFSVQDRSGTPTVWYTENGELIPLATYEAHLAEHNADWVAYNLDKTLPYPGSFDSYMLARGYERHVPYLMNPLPNAQVVYVEAVESDFVSIDADPQMSVLWYEEIPQEFV